MFTKRMSLALTVAVGLAVAAPAAAQQRHAAVPPGHYPPPGLCRIWIDGVPPGRQPPVMSCARARREAPRNARIIYGSDIRHASEGKWKRGMPDRDRRCDRECRIRRERERQIDERRRRERDGARRIDGDLCVDANRNGRCDWAERGERRRTDEQQVEGRRRGPVWGALEDVGRRGSS
ncbi:MAG: hypothetical protein M3373_09640 [Gemmatimonadota bacterium]|nr:hypothetical protein [Gemmatimonadota bacterium]